MRDDFNVLTDCPICWRAFGVHIDRHTAQSYAITNAGREALRQWEREYDRERAALRGLESRFERQR